MDETLMKILITSALLLLSPLVQAGAVCTPADAGTLRLALKDKAETELIFFASWCASCKKHLIEARSSDVLIAVFDEQAAAEKVVTQFAPLPSRRCYWDSDGTIATAYEVKGLPAQRKPLITPK